MQRAQVGIYSAHVEEFSYPLVSALNPEQKRREEGVPEMPCASGCKEVRLSRLHGADWSP